MTLDVYASHERNRPSALSRTLATTARGQQGRRAIGAYLIVAIGRRLSRKPRLPGGRSKV